MLEVGGELDLGEEPFCPDLAFDPIPIRERALKAAEEFGRGCLRL